MPNRVSAAISNVRRPLYWLSMLLISVLLGTGSVAASSVQPRGSSPPSSHPPSSHPPSSHPPSSHPPIIPPHHSVPPGKRPPRPPRQRPSRSGINDPRVRAWLLLLRGWHVRLARFPGGCITLVHDRVCLPAVTVDGQRLSDQELLNTVVNIGSNPQETPVGTPFSNTRIIQAAIAVEVFQHLLYLEARRSNITASTTQAQALAREELKLYLQKGASNWTYGTEPSIIPTGMTPQQYFLSAAVVEAYRIGLIVGQERQRITHSAPGKPSETAFHAWFRQVLPRHRVTVNGRPPAFSLAAVLPPYV